MPLNILVSLSPFMRKLISAIVVSLSVSSGQARAQSMADVVAGVHVRANGDRATNDGIRRFSVAGTVVSADSGRIILRTNDQLTDTVSLLGIRRLDLFQGVRSRGEMVTTGAVTGGVIGVGVWLLARQTVRPTTSSTTDIDNSGKVVVKETSSPVPTIVHALRNSIPLFVATGAGVGLLIGPEHWVRIAVPESVFPQAR